MSIIQTASFSITKEIGKIMKEYHLSPSNTQIIGGGGGASVLVPFVAKQLGIKYSKCMHAEIISSIGVASSMLQEELEITIVITSYSIHYTKLYEGLQKKAPVEYLIVEISNLENSLKKSLLR